MISEELRQKAGALERTCCTRAEARILYDRATWQATKEEIVSAYAVLERKLHDYCPITGSETSKQNGDVVEKTLDAALEILSEATGHEAVVSAVMSLEYVFSTGGADLPYVIGLEYQGKFEKTAADKVQELLSQGVFVSHTTKLGAYWLKQFA